MPRLCNRGKDCVADEESIHSNIIAKSQRARTQKTRVRHYLKTHILIS